MSQDVTKYTLGKGTMTWTPDGGSGQTLGFTVTGVELSAPRVYGAITPEEGGETPTDYIDLGGPVILYGESYQWDDTTRSLIGKHFVSSGEIRIGMATVGQLASAQSLGTCTFIPDASGALALQGYRCVALTGAESSFRVAFRRRVLTTFSFAIGFLPDPNTSDRQVRLYTYTP